MFLYCAFCQTTAWTHQQQFPAAPSAEGLPDVPGVLLLDPSQDRPTAGRRAADAPQTLRTGTPATADSGTAGRTPGGADGTAGRTDGTAGRTDGTTARTDGTAGRTDGTASRTDGTTGRTDDTAGRTDGTAGPTDGTTGRTDGTASRTDGTTARTGGTAGGTDGTTAGAAGTPAGAAAEYNWKVVYACAAKDDGFVSSQSVVKKTIWMRAAVVTELMN